MKSHAFWWLLNYKDSRWKDFAVNEALKTRGLYDPAAVTIAPLIVPAPQPTKLPAAAEIALLTGDAKRGATIGQACYLCHRIGSQGVDYAPALTGFASRQPTEVVINAIIDPSADIAHGYGGTEIALKDGTALHGLLLSEGDPLIVQSTGGVIQLVPADKVSARRRLNRSLMLSADELALSAQDVADVAAWLKTQ